MATDPFEKFNSTPPTIEEPIASGEQNTGGEPPIITGVVDTPPTAQTDQTAEPPKVDEFIETFNKRFNTQYKADDEIKPLFELPKKVSDYENKLKDREELAKSVEKYKKDLENLNKSSDSKYLEDPLMQKAWVAKELKKKYPDKDPFVLQEIAMSDLSQMSDLDAVAKERKIKYPSMKLENIKAVILNDLGLDKDQSPEEWDSLAKDKLTMMAGDARESIRRLTDGIELPKVESPEEAAKRSEEMLSKRIAEVAPQKEAFSRFEKFKMGDELEYTAPKEFQDKLGDMFDAFVVKAGNDPTPENIQTLSDLRDAFFFSSYKKEIYDVMRKDAETKVKAEWEAKLGNTSLPNTSTAADGAGTASGTKPGHSDFVRDNQGDRVRHFG